jgi:hypothetical protein
MSPAEFSRQLGAADAEDDDGLLEEEDLDDWSRIQIPFTVDKTNEAYANAKIEDIQVSHCKQQKHAVEATLLAREDASLWVEERIWNWCDGIGVVECMQDDINVSR